MCGTSVQTVGHQRKVTDCEFDSFPDLLGLNTVYFVLEHLKRCVLQLYAGVLAKEPMSLEKAKTYLEKALKLDPSHLDAVYIMADIFSQQHHFDKGIEL